MGCTFSGEVEEKKDRDLVGMVSGRSRRDMDINAVPKERRSMVNMELLAEQQTIYRAKHVHFQRQNSLEFDSKVYHMLRKILDEPIGRFYVREYTIAKKIPHMREKVECWTTIQLLGDQENDINVPASDLETSSQDDTKGAAATPVPESPVKSPKEQLDDLLDNFIEPGGANFVHPVDPSREASLSKELSRLRSLPVSEDVTLYSVRQKLSTIQNIVFREMAEDAVMQKFKEHSEYKRYKMKVQKVYNAISHRDFDFLATLGKGSFGRVLAVRKQTTQKVYALKVMSKKKILSGAEIASQVTIERQVVVTCSDCRFVVTPYFAFQTTRALFLALELLEGGNLVEAMSNSGGHMNIDSVRFHSAQIILGLQYLHKHGIIYRDLKPLNVMLDRHGNAVLTDLGLCAKIKESQFPKSQGGLTAHGERLKQRKSMEIIKPESLKCVGTYGFRAPEALNEEKEKGYGIEVDYWALGVTMYYLLEAKFPFKEKMTKAGIFGAGNVDQKQAERRLHKNPRQFPEYFTEDLTNVINGFLSIDPTKRLGPDLEAVKNLPFYSSIDWAKLEDGTHPSPYKPVIRQYGPDTVPQFNGLVEAMSNFSTDNVLEMFGGENDMHDEYTHVKRKDQKLFKEWDYFPDETLRLDWDLMDKKVGRKDTIVCPT